MEFKIYYYFIASNGCVSVPGTDISLLKSTDSPPNGELMRTKLIL